MRLSWNPLAIVAAVAFGIAFAGVEGWFDGVDIQAWTLGGLFFLALSGVVIFGPVQRSSG